MNYDTDENTTDYPRNYPPPAKSMRKSKRGMMGDDGACRVFTIVCTPRQSPTAACAFAVLMLLNWRGKSAAWIAFRVQTPVFADCCWWGFTFCCAHNIVPETPSHPPFSVISPREQTTLTATRKVFWAN